MHKHQRKDRPHGDGLPTCSSPLYTELVNHLPFSVSAVAIGLTVAGLICFITPMGQLESANGAHAEHALTDGVAEDHVEHAGRCEHAGHNHDNPFQDLFHLFHPLHMLFSAAATTAMFWRYERRVLKATIIGLVGAIGVCGLSDIVVPQLSLILLGKPMPWHICVIQHPEMVLPFAIVGIAVGLAASGSVRSSTFFSHSLHVFSSTMASIFYLIGPFGRLGWIDSLGLVFLFIIIAVMVPCCLSDIVFPLFLIKGAQKQYRDEHACCG